MAESMHPAVVCRAVADYFGVPLELLMSRARDQPIVLYRQVAMYLCRRLCPEWSSPAIGRIFGRDHSTILYAEQKMAQTPTRAPLAYDMDAIVKALRDAPSSRTDEIIGWFPLTQPHGSRFTSPYTGRS